MGPPTAFGRRTCWFRRDFACYLGSRVTPAFRLDKWYFDCVSPQGDASPSPPLPAPQLHLGALLAAAPFGLLAGCAMGVDLPESERPLSRLA